MKICSSLFILYFCTSTLFAQQISTADKGFLLKKEDSLKTVGLKIVQGRNAADRFFADSAFTR
ncbi:MAG: hypothetical protein ACKVOM_05540, partial [Ferruginibacter sp.]